MESDEGGDGMEWFAPDVDRSSGQPPLLPIELPDAMIQRMTRCNAYYAALNALPAFRQSLDALIRNWSDGAALRFSADWALGRHGYKDLCFSRDLVRLMMISSTKLAAGGRGLGSDRREVARRLKSAGDLAKGAQRLVRHAVLGWSWREIARAEAAAGGRVFVDDDDFDNYVNTIKQDVRRWRKALGIPAAKRPRALIDI